MKARSILLPTLAALGAACGDPQGQEEQSQAQAPANDHGAETDLGTVTLAGKELHIVRLGDLVPGKEGAFEVHGDGLVDADLKALDSYLWVESEDGTQLSAPEKGLPDGYRLHFHVTPRKGEKSPSKVVLRLRVDGGDERASLPLGNGGH